MNVKKVLEFDKIIMAISENAILETTQERILKLGPGLERRVVETQLKRVQDLKDLIVYDEGIHISEVIDIEKVILPKLAMVGNILSEGELYLLRESLRSFRQAKNKILSLEEKYRVLHEHYHNAPTYKPLEDLIERIVDENREIKTDATLELANIIEQQKSLKAQIKRKLDEIMSEKEYEHALQDRVVTIRNERFVVPIKATHKGHIKGIEHDRSESSMTVFIEPMPIVSLNNRVRELMVREKDEKRKILIRITDQLRIHSDGLQVVHNFIIQLDFDLSLAIFMKESNGEVPEITGGSTLALFKARHPLLSKENVVPVDVSIVKDSPLFLITGPNTGGKTVLLKTIGLLSLMALSGIAIPASERSIIPLFDSIFADIGDEQSIEQSLSSFSGHLKNVQEIFSQATERSLILLDELCSGTDPVEGAALAMAMVEHIEEIGCKAVITTHYSEVKSFAFNHPRIATASMEFDVETLSPTYKLLIGVPGESNAINISRKLKLNPKIIDAAQRFLSEDSKKVETLIQELAEKTKELESERSLVEAEKTTLQAKQILLEGKIIALEQEKIEIEDRANKRAEELIISAQEKAKAIIAKLQSNDLSKEQAKEDMKSLNMLRMAITDTKVKNEASRKALKHVLNKQLKVPISVGEVIFSKSLKKEVVVLNTDHKGKLLVQAGILKLAIDFDDVEKISKKAAKKSTSPRVEKSRVASSKIDLRGKMVMEAIDDLEHELDTASLHGYGEVEIIHGKGTGALRDAVQEYLRESHYIDKYRNGLPQEGGFGVTIATLK